APRRLDQLPRLVQIPCVHQDPRQIGARQTPLIVSRVVREETLKISDQLNLVLRCRRVPALRQATKRPLGTARVSQSWGRCLGCFAERGRAPQRERQGGR